MQDNTGIYAIIGLLIGTSLAICGSLLFLLILGAIHRAGDALYRFKHRNDPIFMPSIWATETLAQLRTTN